MTGQAKSLADLVIAAQNGDEKAFAALIEASQDRLYKFCLYLCGNRALAEDICQDTFIKILERLAKLKKPESFISWMLQAAKNQYFDYLRSSARRTQPIDEDFDLSDENLKAGETESLVELKRALLRLSPEERVILLLVDLEGYSYQEAAQIQGVTENAMRSRIFRARQQLAEIFESERNEIGSKNVYPSDTKGGRRK